jgi:hypothetical protein
LPQNPNGSHKSGIMKNIFLPVAVVIAFFLSGNRPRKNRHWRDQSGIIFKAENDAGRSIHQRAA